MTGWTTGLARRGVRQVEGEPEIPAAGAVRGRKFAVGFEIHIALQAAVDGKDVADLRPHADDTRLETSQFGALATVASELVIKISDDAGMKMRVEELRHGPVEMRVDPVGVIGVGVLEIPGETKHGRSLEAAGLIEVGVAAPAVDRGMPKAEIGKARGTVVADGNV